MNRETFINEDKTILNTDFYLYLLSQENILTEFEKFLENRLKDTYANNDMAKGYKNALKISLCKLQKLKEGKK